MGDFDKQNVISWDARGVRTVNGVPDDTEVPYTYPYADPTDEGNSTKYHTGALCVEPGCDKPAGTAWSPHWCFECNVKRMDSISAGLAEAKNQLLRKSGT